MRLTLPAKATLIATALSATVMCIERTAAASVDCWADGPATRTGGAVNRLGGDFTPNESNIFVGVFDSYANAWVG